MATAVCDTKPCDRMQGLIKTAEMFKTQGGKPALMLAVATSTGKGVAVEVHYCPFCGTRVVQGVLTRVAER